MFSYFMLRLTVSYRCPMLLICWRLPSCSVLSLNLVGFVFFLSVGGNFNVVFSFWVWKSFGRISVWSH